MGARLHRAAEQERAVQEGRRPAQRARPHPAHLQQARVRLDRPGRPARPVPVDGALHPARPWLRRRQDRDARGGGARRRVLHDAGPLRRPAAARRHGPGAGRDRTGVRARHRRRDRPGEHPVPLDPDRGRAGDLAEAGRRRPGQHRGVRRRSAALPGIAGGRRRQGRDHRRLRGARGDQAARDQQPGVLQPAAQVQDRAHRPPEPRRGPGDQRHRLRRHRAPGARTRLRRVGRRRPLDQPDAGPEARRVDPPRGRGRRLGGRHLDLPRLRLPQASLAGPAEVPGRRLGCREVPRGARERVPRPRARAVRLAALPHRPPRPRRRARAEGRQLLRRPRATAGPDLRHHAGASWPT